MEDALRALTQIEGLEPRDAIISRALIRNKFLAAEVVLAAARDAAEAGIGLLDKLTGDGTLAPESANKIVRALEAKIAQKRSAPAEELPTPEPLPDEPEQLTSEQKRGGAKGPKVWKPKPKADDRSGETSVVLLGALRDEYLRRERERVELFIERYVRSRLHELLLSQLVRQKEGLADPNSLARKTGSTAKEVKRILEDWKSKGLLKASGSYPYCYMPQKDDKTEIERFMKAWKDSARHPSLLKKILELEMA